MTDRELLELAAKAQGYKYMNSALWDGRDVVAYSWNPLTDDGDALRLAVKLGLRVGVGLTHTSAVIAANSDDDDSISRICAHNGDPYAATRRAIVRAAAEIGKEMK